MSRDEFLFYARRLHNSFIHLIKNNGDDSPHWRDNPEMCAHHLCGIYIAGMIAYLEGKYGKNAWKKPGKKETDFDKFVSKKPKLHKKGVSKERLNAFLLIRHAVVHNNCDLSKNTDKKSLKKVKNAKFGPMITFTGPVFTLVSDKKHDIMELARLSMVAVAQYHGDG